MNKPYEDIKPYLNALKNAMQGQPAGLIQDALYDVENHFYEALATDKSATMDALVDAFGTPQEVASQYIQLEEDAKRFLNGTASKKPMFNGFFEPLSCFSDYKN